VVRAAAIAPEPITRSQPRQPLARLGIRSRHTSDDQAKSKENRTGQSGARRETGDRLTCQHGGTDVYQYAALTIAEYVRAGHCPDLRWDFVGGTGGA
jgi:hypothetical protein